MSRLYEQGMFFIGSSFRRTLTDKSQRFPWHQWVRLAYNDALTYDPSTGKGGVKASWRFREIGRAAHNRPLLGLAVELQNLKANEELPFDKLSMADYSVAAAFTTIQWADGPVMLDEFAYGRKDASSAEECGSTSQVSSDAYVANLQAKGFSDEEIVALASVEAFGITRDPEQARWSAFPKFDNYYYKQVLTNAQGVPLS